MLTKIILCYNILTGKHFVPCMFWWVEWQISSRDYCQKFSPCKSRKIRGFIECCAVRPLHPCPLYPPMITGQHKVQPPLHPYIQPESYIHTSAQFGNLGNQQRRIQKPVKYLRLSVLRK